MPRLTDDMQQGKLAGNFTYTGTRIDRLGASEYTLVTIAVDETSSVAGFHDQLREMLVTSVAACKKSPRSDNLLIRVVTFSSRHNKGVNEIHGFKPLSEIDTAQYPDIRPGGMTPLCDACYSSVGAMNAYAKDLAENDYLANAIAFIITDGGENDSTATMRMVKDVCAQALQEEVLESMISILIGINAENLRAVLETFQREAGINKYRDAGDVTEGALAKLADFVSQSISSQSQALGTGGPSQNIAATI